MTQRFIVLLFFSIEALCGLSGCRERPASVAPDVSVFKDEQSMRAALTGTWILQEYIDSTDAGLTPKLLEYMFSRWNQINYDIKSGHAQIFSLVQDRDAKGFSDTEYLDSCIVTFMPRDNKMIFRIGYGERMHRAPAVDTAEFLISGGDTLLRVYKDSAVIDFEKYGIGKCEKIDAYNHLVNSKFIAGKYYALSDTARRHHIIFTRCGEIEGAENIEPQFHSFTNYGVVTRGFFTEPDEIAFFDSRDTRMDAESMLVPWRVVEDSLILGDHIVLVRWR